ncbi:MAG TPA: hypothetical protein VFN75_07290 [Pseudonocardiaceae bacterium]|nr:hypothetical protein [Pseudonocardiaceae bacterium]
MLVVLACRDLDGDLHGMTAWPATGRATALHPRENLMSTRLDPKLAREVRDEATRAETAAMTNAEAEFPANASISWPPLTARWANQQPATAVQRPVAMRFYPRLN